MVTKYLLEAASLVADTASEDGTWKVRLISEGRGSSGIYTASLLENYHHAFNNVLSFRNHPGASEGPETRDFTMIAGKIVGETWVDTDERGLKAIYANYLPDPEYKDKIARYKDRLGLSIYIEGTGYEDANGDYIVESFRENDPFGSVDVVIAPGARGKFMESMRHVHESQRGGSEMKPGVTSAQEKRELVMEKDVEERFVALERLLTALVDENKAKESHKAQVEADAAAVKAAVESYDMAVKAIESAELLAPQVESLRAEAKAGKDILPLIESAKKVKEAAIEAARVTEAATRDFGAVRVESAADLGKVFG